MYDPQDNVQSPGAPSSEPDNDVGVPQARQEPVAPQPAPEPSQRRVEAPPPPRPSPPHPGGFSRMLASAGKRFATLAIALIAIVVAIATWQSYVLGPWTRNGTVRVQVANVAPQVSGQIVELRVNDNQYVRQGDVLYVIDPSDYQVALDISKSQVAAAAADLQVKEADSKRRQSLTTLSTSVEEQQTYAAAAAASKATFEAAQQQQTKAELDLKRTTVVSPVTGYVTNLLLRVGDFAVAGNSNITVIDAESFWIDGYFEETKMARICVNDRAEAQLMGYSAPILGRVETVTRGVSVANAAPGAQGLPNVNPIYTWVRLAQRVPVRIAIDKVPSGVPLVSGMTATVTIRQPADEQPATIFDRGYANVVENLSALIYGPPPPRPDCIPVMTTVAAPPEVLPVAPEPSAETSGQVLPGIAPGIDTPPAVTD